MDKNRCIEHDVDVGLKHGKRHKTSQKRDLSMDIFYFSFVVESAGRLAQQCRAAVFPVPSLSLNDSAQLPHPVHIQTAGQARGLQSCLSDPVDTREVGYQYI